VVKREETDAGDWSSLAASLVGGGWGPTEDEMKFGQNRQKRGRRIVKRRCRGGLLWTRREREKLTDIWVNLGEDHFS